MDYNKKNKFNCSLDDSIPDFDYNDYNDNNNNRNNALDCHGSLG